MGTTNWLYIAARLWRFMMKVNRDGVGGYAMQRYILWWLLFVFLILGGAEGLESGVEESNNSSERQRDYSREYSAQRKRRDGKEEREMGGNERGHSLCIVNTVDWGALHVLFNFFSQHDLFDLLSISQRRMYLNELEVHLRKPLHSCGCLYSPFTFLGSRPWLKQTI